MVCIQLPAFDIVKESWDNRVDFHASGELMWLDKSCPWKAHVFSLEEKQGKEGLVKFVIYKDERNMFRIQAVPARLNDFANRVSLCEAYRGLRAKELSELMGVEDAEFAHAGGFIGGAWSLETVIKMAEASIEEAKSKK